MNRRDEYERELAMAKPPDMNGVEFKAFDYGNLD